jgi:hypothetical protein
VKERATADNSEEKEEGRKEGKEFCVIIDLISV